MSCPEVYNDTASYVKDVIAERLEQGKLTVGNSTLCIDIKNALIEGAYGMSVSFCKILKF